MIKYPEGAKENQRKIIDMLNEALGDTELTLEEEKTFIWLSGWETSTVKNIINVFKKTRRG